MGLVSIFSNEAPPFIFSEIRQHAVLVGFVSGIVRIVAAFGVFKGKKWGLALGIVFSDHICVINFL